MPLNPNKKILSNLDRNKGNQSNLYAQLLGELQFVANSTCPNIAFAVNHLALYTVGLMLHRIT
jgi:hypothetical protein